MKEKRDYDIAIIGGGPAGSVSAMLLAKAGYSVVLFERSAFPREVLCGEFISKEFTSLLEEQNLSAKFMTLNPVQISKLKIIDSSGKSFESELGFKAYGLRRSVLDEFLLNEAKNCGAEVIQPASVIEVNQNENYCTLVVKKENEITSFKSKFVVAAYGKHNILDKQLNREFVQHKTKLTGIKYHVPSVLLDDFYDDEIRIYTAGKIYCGVNKVDAGITTICFLTDYEEYKLGPFEHLEKLAAVNPEFGVLINTEKAKSDVVTVKGAGNIYFGKRSLSDGRIFYAGDAAGMIAPLTGDGISIAGESAKIISEVITNHFNSDVEQISDSYKIAWKAKFKRRMFFGSMIQTVFLSGMMRKSGVRIASAFPQIVPYLISSTRG